MSSPTRECPGSEVWERYVLDSTIAEHDELARHLEKCPYCRRVVNEFSQLWTDVAQSARAREGSRADIIILTPVWTPDTQSALALAARGEPSAAMTQSATLASPDRTIWLRAVRDAHTRDLWLYLISEDDPKLAANAMVRPFGSERDFVTDTDGRINLGPVDWPQGELLKAEVHLPKAIFRLEPIREFDDASGRTMLTSPGGDQIRLSWTGDRRNRHLTVEIVALSGLVSDAPLKAAVRASDQTTPAAIQTVSVAQPASFEHVGVLGSLEVFIYQ